MCGIRPARAWAQTQSVLMLEHRVASRVGPVDDGAAEHSILAKQFGCAGDFAGLDGSAEAVGEHDGGG